MPNQEEMLKRVADRCALVLMAYWTKHGTFQPFVFEDNFKSDAFEELREMPEYREAMDVVRNWVRQ